MKLHIYAHEELKQIIDLQLNASITERRYLYFSYSTPKEEETILLEDNNNIKVVNPTILNHFGHPQVLF